MRRGVDSAGASLIPVPPWAPSARRCGPPNRWRDAARSAGSQQPTRVRDCRARRRATSKTVVLPTLVAQAFPGARRRRLPGGRAVGLWGAAVRTRPCAGASIDPDTADVVTPFFGLRLDLVRDAVLVRAPRPVRRARPQPRRPRRRRIASRPTFGWGRTARRTPGCRSSSRAGLAPDRATPKRATAA